MNKLLLIAILSLPVTASASIQGDFTDTFANGNDKIAHAIVGLAVTGLTYVFCESCTVAQSFLVGVSVGVLKEVADMRPGGTGFDGYDAAATAIGAFGGGLVVQHLDKGLGLSIKYKWGF